jgi:mono/diheme cytochrome c family protein
LNALVKCSLGALLLVAVGCDMPTPQAPAEAIGEYPVWGQGFGEEANLPRDDSLLAPEGPAPSDDPNAAATSGGGGSTTPNQPSPFANESWSGGDASYGKQVFATQCASCHGMEGKGGNVPGVGMVPTLRDPSWHERTTEKQLASTIAHGKGAMPGFMDKLDGKELRGLIAFLRSLPGS